MVRYLFYTIGDLTYQSPLVVSLSAIPTARLYQPGNTPGTYFCYEAESKTRP